MSCLSLVPPAARVNELSVSAIPAIMVGYAADRTAYKLYQQQAQQPGVNFFNDPATALASQFGRTWFLYDYQMQINIRATTVIGSS